MSTEHPTTHATARVKKTTKKAAATAKKTTKKAATTAKASTAKAATVASETTKKATSTAKAAEFTVPSVDLSRFGLPKFEGTTLHMPKVELPKVELPKVELPKVELPKVDLHRLDLRKVDLADLTELADQARTRVHDTASSVRGSVSHTVTLLREAVGV